MCFKQSWSAGGKQIKSTRSGCVNAFGSATTSLHLSSPVSSNLNWGTFYVGHLLSARSLGWLLYDKHPCVLFCEWKLNDVVLWCWYAKEHDKNEHTVTASKGTRLLDGCMLHIGWVVITITTIKVFWLTFVDMLMTCIRVCHVTGWRLPTTHAWLVIDWFPLLTIIHQSRTQQLPGSMTTKSLTTWWLLTTIIFICAKPNIARHLKVSYNLWSFWMTFYLSESGRPCIMHCVMACSRQALTSTLCGATSVFQ